MQATWDFVATEINAKSYNYACDNVERNKLSQRIRVVKNDDPHKVLCGVVATTGGGDIGGGGHGSTPEGTKGTSGAEKTQTGSSARPVVYQSPLDPTTSLEHAAFDFVMCNPPFFDIAEQSQNRSGKALFQGCCIRQSKG